MKEESNNFFKPLSELKQKYNAISQANKIDILTQKIEKLESLFLTFMSKFDGKCNHCQKSPTTQNNQSTRQQKQPTQLEPRFTQLRFYIQKTIGMQQSKRMQHLKEFSADLARKVVSKGFIWYEQGKFTDQKFRHFFCNNFLSNIVRYAITNKLNQKQLQNLDLHLKHKVLDFLKQKYPQNQNHSSNLKFSSIIIPVDNFQANQNDLVHKTGIKFKYKKNGDYCKEIMQFINYIVELIRQQQQDGKTLFQHFANDMDNIFKMVQSQQWMIRAQADLFQIQNQDLKALHKPNSNYHIHGKSKKKKKISYKQSKQQQYRKQVKQYTKYSIGKKISDNVSPFSKKQIQQQNLTITSAQIMRIMTKWCQQLEKCFSEVNIYSRDQRFMMQDGTQRYLKKQTRQELFIQIQEQQVELQKFIQQVKSNIYENQCQIFKDSKRIYDFTDFASTDEETAGYFATVMRKSYQNYLISYLNELIHRILTAKQKLKQKHDKKDYYKIATSLISFKIADLLRCKCSSKQTQIIALYKYLKKYSEKFPQKLELVRVKNRLNEGTKDILINFMYRKKLLVQVQLSINQDTSNFIKCSDKANHFLYEIQRATFGPISEICNVYCSVDPRADYFTKLFQAFNQKTIQKGKVPTCKHKLKQFSLPLWCSQCNKFISRSNLIAKHIKCQKCHYSKCSFCLIRDGQIQKFQVSRKKLNYQDLIKSSNSIIRRKIQIWNLDKKNSYKSNICIVYFNFKLMFFQSLQQNQDYIFLGQAKNQKQFNNFFSQKQIIQQQIITKPQQSLLISIHHEIVKLMIKNVNKRHRKYFVIQQLKIDQNIPFKQKMLTVQMINMNNIHIQSIRPLVQAFPNAKLALLVKNKITDLKDIQKWQYIEQLNLQGNSLKQLPAQIKQLKNLKFLVLTHNKFIQFQDQLCQILSLQTLNFKQNQIQKISANIGRLANLKRLRLSQNNIKVIPPQIIQLKQLIEIDFSKNKIQKIPQQLKKLVKLQIVAFKKNNLSSIDENTFQKMNEITKVDFSNNKLQKIPDSLKDKQKLLLIDFENNKITKIPQFIFKLSKLEELQLNKNLISQIQISGTISSKLKILSLVQNKLSAIPKQIFQIKTIQAFNLGRNLFKQIPFQILNLKHLKQVNFEDFNLKQFPSIIFRMENLQKINLDYNQISSMPAEIRQFAESLRQLQLNYNKFTKFPKQVLCLANLESLGMNGNFISQFPVEITQLQNLQRLKLEQIDIKTLPIQFGKNIRLRQLFITEDRLSDKQSFKKILQTNEKIKNSWKQKQKKANEKEKQNK